MTQRNTPVNLEKVIKDLNPLLRGFANYFRIADCTGEYQRLSSWIRRRLRAIQLKLWKKPNRLHCRLRQLGYAGEFDAIKMNFLGKRRLSTPPLCLAQQLSAWGIGAL